MKITQPRLKMPALALYVSDGSTAWRPAGATRHAARLLVESNEGDRFLRNIDVPCVFAIAKRRKCEHVVAKRICQELTQKPEYPKE